MHIHLIHKAFRKAIIIVRNMRHSITSHCYFAHTKNIKSNWNVFLISSQRIRNRRHICAHSKSENVQNHKFIITPFFRSETCYLFGIEYAFGWFVETHIPCYFCKKFLFLFLCTYTRIHSFEETGVGDKLFWFRYCPHVMEAVNSVYWQQNNKWIPNYV